MKSKIAGDESRNQTSAQLPMNEGETKPSFLFLRVFDYVTRDQITLGKRTTGYIVRS